VFDEFDSALRLTLAEPTINHIEIPPAFPAQVIESTLLNCTANCDVVLDTGIIALQKTNLFSGTSRTAPLAPPLFAKCVHRDDNLGAKCFVSTMAIDFKTSESKADQISKHSPSRRIRRRAENE